MEKENVLDSTIQKQDAPAIKAMMETAHKDGYRFVSYPLASSGLTKEDFAPFKTAFEAMHDAFDKSTDRDTYAIRSISVVSKEADRVLQSQQSRAPQQRHEDHSVERWVNEKDNDKDKGMSR